MKKEKRKSLIKSARKNARKTIQQNLLIELKRVSANWGAGTNKLEKVIEKSANKFAKKIAKEIQLDEVAITAKAELLPIPNIESNSDTITKKRSVKKVTANSAEKKAKTPDVVTAS